MLRILPALVACVVTISVAQAGTVNLLPMQPTTGGKLTVEYKPGEAEHSWSAPNTKLHATMLGFREDAEIPTAIELPLKYDGKRWSGEYQVPDGVAFVMVKVGDGKRYDINDELYWSTLVYDANGKPLPGANMRAAHTYMGMLPPECKRKQDLNESVDLLREETKHYPRNLSAAINLVMLEASIGTNPPEEAQAKLRQLVQPNMVPQSPDEAIAIASALRALQNETDATRTMLDAAQRFPGTKVSEQIALEDLSKITNIDDFAGRAAAHLEQYPNTFARAGLIGSVISSTTQQGAFGALIRFLDRVPHLPAMVYYQAVNYVGAQDTLRNQAMRLLDEGLRAADDDKARLPYIGPTEWAAQQNIAKSQLYFVKGAIARNDGAVSQAVDAFKESVKLAGNETDRGVFEMLIGTLAGIPDHAGVIQYSEMALSAGAGTQNIVDAYTASATANGKSASEVQQKIASLKKMGQGAMVERLSREMLNQPMVDGTFTALNGTKLKISDWKGKVVVLDYWATWCGPCRKSFPSMQKLYEMYKGNPNVVFAIVNVWERTEDRMKIVQDFLSKSPELSFPVYFDMDDSVVSKYGVTGIPTKFFLGKDGRIQFKEVGLAPDEQFIEDSSKKIDVLLAQ
jgi:thiol-disulfide isomerase/thioredoxin